MSDGPANGIAKAVFDLVPGLEWPAGDEDELRAAAAAWADLATVLDEIAAAATAAAGVVTGQNHGAEIDAFAAFFRRYDNGAGLGYLPESAVVSRQMASALEQYADQVAEAKHRVIVECTIAGAAILAGVGLFAIPVVGQFAAASAAATAAALVATTSLIGIALSTTAASIVATVLVGAAFGAVSAAAIDVVIAQPIRMAFGDQAWWDWNADEVLAWAKGGLVGGGIAGSLSGAAHLSGVMSSGMAAASPRLAAVLGRLPHALTTRTGQVLAGTGVNAATGYALNGRVTGMDVITGALGGGAGTRAGRGAAHGPMLDAIEPLADPASAAAAASSGFRARLRGLAEVRSVMEAPAGLPKLPQGWDADAVVTHVNGSRFGGDFTVSTLADDGRRLELAVVDVTGHGIDVAPQTLLFAGSLKELLGAHPGGDFLPAANAHVAELHSRHPAAHTSYPPVVHLSLDLQTGEYALGSAGASGAIHYSARTGHWEVFEATSPLLGMVPELYGSPRPGVLEPGDAMLLFTDGMVENRSEGSLPGIERLIAEAGPFVSGGSNKPAHIIAEAVPSYGDDRTLVMIRRAPATDADA